MYFSKAAVLSLLFGTLRAVQTIDLLTVNSKRSLSGAQQDPIYEEVKQLLAEEGDETFTKTTQVDSGDLVEQEVRTIGVDSGDLLEQEAETIGVVNLDSSSNSQTGSRTTAKTKYNEWAAPDTPQMEAAIFQGRSETVPAIKPNVTDHEWYKGDYSKDLDNKLEELSYKSNMTGPTAAQVAKEETAGEGADARMIPLEKADEAEADTYYRSDYPRDMENDLDVWTAQRNYSKTDTA